MFCYSSSAFRPCCRLKTYCRRNAVAYQRRHHFNGSTFHLKASRLPAFFLLSTMPSPSMITRSLRPFRQATRRGYAIPARGPPNLQVFNRNTKWLQRERAASDVESSRRVDYLRDEVAARLCDRLLVCCFSMTISHSYLPTPCRISTANSTTSSTLAQMPATLLVYSPNLQTFLAMKSFLLQHMIQSHPV